ncbi:glycosyltransferase, group 2 family protein [Caballeronia hypogeia]|uniref:Glycosyltransferase, group 2 family protein n=1 Tax=Caballeronia hypogeia TaxID=1777140 RepID=A0A158CDQ2_9BURK|nr:glycosyltransferase family 2 protein [Caballeronia hypogeia]SAK80454.1 glycosyltransferase, group 2 family protein [Caballeronia hypogeia]
MSMSSGFLTIVTPTFNRAHCLPRLYESLAQQTDRDFEWIIVDDGSTDATPEFCAAMMAQSQIPVRVIRKVNGGKHTALNAAISAVSSELVFIVDSDDYVTPNAVSRIRDIWSTHRAADRSGICFLRGTTEHDTLGSRFPVNGEIASYIEMRFNRGVKGDKAEVYRSDLLRKFPFPEFEGERFLAEDAVWAPLGLEYKMVHVNEIIYVGNYLEAGLTQGGKSYMVKCPNGAIESVRWFMSPKVDMKVRMPMAWRYIAYGLFAKRSLARHIVTSEAPLFVASQLPAGIALYFYWRRKFRSELSAAQAVGGGQRPAASA